MKQTYFNKSTEECEINFKEEEKPSWGICLKRVAFVLWEQHQNTFYNKVPPSIKLWTLLLLEGGDEYDYLLVYS